jgi:hypothetical protein
VATNRLSVSEIEAAKPRQSPYKLFDGGGLFLLVRPDGSRYWRLKYYVTGKEKLISLGVYPRTTLKKARQRRDEARDLLEGKVDPSAQRKEDKVARRNAEKNTFEAVGREWFAKRLSRGPRRIQ